MKFKQKTKKKKFLSNSEASFTLSGFGTYGKEVLSRLQKTDKFEIAELATYAQILDPRDDHVTSKYYANEPGNDIRRQE